jgi:hypothetical protein
VRRELYPLHADMPPTPHTMRHYAVLILAITLGGSLSHNGMCHVVVVALTAKCLPTSMQSEQTEIPQSAHLATALFPQGRL